MVFSILFLRTCSPGLRSTLLHRISCSFLCIGYAVTFTFTFAIHECISRSTSSLVSPPWNGHLRHQLCSGYNETIHCIYYACTLEYKSMQGIFTLCENEHIYSIRHYSIWKVSPEVTDMSQISPHLNSIYISKVAHPDLQ